MAFALKSANADCYLSNRVFEGVRVKDAETAAKHVARLKKLLGRENGSKTSESHAAQTSDDVKQ